MPNKTYKPKRTGTIKPTEIDWVRAACYIDGEGCISSSTAYNKRKCRESLYIVVSVHNTDPRLPDWFVERFGGRVWKTTQKNEDWAPAYGWKLVCQQAKTFLEQCLPWFIIKREQAEVAIALMNTYKRWGRAGMPEGTVEERWRLRNELSAMKGVNSRIKKVKPRVIDYVTHATFTGKEKQAIN